MPSHGFSSWERIRGLAWGFQHTFRAGITVGAIFDRDYWPDEEVASILSELRRHISLAHILASKEIENYLLAPDALDRVLQQLVSEKQKRTGDPMPRIVPVRNLLEDITQTLKTATQAQYVSKRTAYLRKRGEDGSTVTAEALRWFDQKWENLATRLTIVPGKEVLEMLRRSIQATYGVTLTDYRIIDAFAPSQIPADLRALLGEVDVFRG